MESSCGHGRTDTSRVDAKMDIHMGFVAADETSSVVHHALYTSLIIIWREGRLRTAMAVGYPGADIVDGWRNFSGYDAYSCVRTVHCKLGMYSKTSSAVRCVGACFASLAMPPDASTPMTGYNSVRLIQWHSKLQSPRSSF
ncbi:hypothetical protein H310_02937 [Aphanomyces invadans]|uniref:Uncharacterized protein n=1 Tax=Aphanomyces invadans TaxID=157072 RepID=A0A024UKR2_9STRA|nr:hypothetical protein H310_02937 [Aphanomyces invadans]ETW06780.1 hypothetical protein H310_02937 [Aphanomyces invadans]|eukprot:XP_008864855.1 hypothetical protein H310_02937 [Aphanomyces invadans]